MNKRTKWQIAVGGWCLGLGMMGCVYAVNLLNLMSIFLVSECLRD